MKAFTDLDAIASPVMRQNIDTDIVIPIHRLRDVAQAELGPYAFEPLRYLPDGSDNPDFLAEPAGLRRRARSWSPTTTSPAAPAARARCGR